MGFPPKVAGKSNGYQAKRCGICPVFVDTKSKFSDSESTREYEIISNLYCILDLDLILVLGNTVKERRYLK